MTVFGRDSLLTAWMALPVDQGLARGTLRTLARHQGTVVDARRDEQPGRILHEIRHGMDSVDALGGGSVYYGSVDATPLFVMLLGELHRWGHRRADVDALLPAADRALDWVERYGDRDGDGFVEYLRSYGARPAPPGLEGLVRRHQLRRRAARRATASRSPRCRATPTRRTSPAPRSPSTWATGVRRSAARNGRPR